MKNEGRRERRERSPVRVVRFSRRDSRSASRNTTGRKRKPINEGEGVSVPISGDYHRRAPREFEERSDCRYEERREASPEYRRRRGEGRVSRGYSPVDHPRWEDPKVRVMRDDGDRCKDLYGKKTQRDARGGVHRR